MVFCSNGFIFFKRCHRLRGAAAVKQIYQFIRISWGEPRLQQTSGPCTQLIQFPRSQPGVGASVHPVFDLQRQNEENIDWGSSPAPRQCTQLTHVHPHTRLPPTGSMRSARPHATTATTTQWQSASDIGKTLEHCWLDIFVKFVMWRRFYEIGWW